MQLFLYFLKQSLSFMVCVSVAVTKDKKQTAKSSRPTKSSYHILAENVNGFLLAKKEFSHLHDWGVSISWNIPSCICRKCRLQ